MCRRHWSLPAVRKVATGRAHWHFRNCRLLLARHGAMASDRGGVGADCGTGAWVKGCHAQPISVVRGGCCCARRYYGGCHPPCHGGVIASSKRRAQTLAWVQGAAGTWRATYLRRTRLMLAAYTGTSEIGGHPAAG
jgi:hypothetical protein